LLGDEVQPIYATVKTSMHVARLLLKLLSQFSHEKYPRQWHTQR